MLFYSYISYINIISILNTNNNNIEYTLCCKLIPMPFKSSCYCRWICTVSEV